jgi:hypothetical protein
MFNLSLGGVCPSPAITLLGTTVKPAAAAAAVPKNLRRETEFSELLLSISEFLRLIYFRQLPFDE